MEIEKLRSFLALAREGNFSRAARARQLTQSAVSLHVKALELELDVRLVERLPRRSPLTEEGTLLLEAATRLVDDHDRVLDVFGEMRRSGAGHVRVAATNSIVLYVLPPVVGTYRARWPNVEIALLPARREQILAMVQRGAADLGVAAAGRLPAGLRFQPILSSEIVLITPLDHALATARRVTPADIARHPLVTFPPDSATRQMVDRAFERRGLSARVVLATGGAEVVKRYVEAGLGIGFVSRLSLTADDERRLHVRPVRGFLREKRRYGLVLRGGDPSRAARRFIRLMVPGQR